jgi:hypothetical protein
MSRKSKRELERALDDLECRHEPNTDAALMILPDHSFLDGDLPDVPTDGIRAYNEEIDRREVVVPHHRPEQWWHGRLPVVAESHVAAVWRNMSQEQLTRERQFRDEHDELIPPILEQLNA